MKAAIAILVLAAGSSSRMRGIKQLLPWKKTTLLGHALTTALEVNPESVTVVLGAEAEHIKPVIPSGVHSVVNNAWEEGMGTSIASGVANLLAREQAFEGILIMLSDQPLISPQYLKQLIEAFDSRTADLIATSYDQKVGVPALFGPAYYQELLKLEGEQGARQLLQNHALKLLSLNPGNAILDIDTESDYRNLFDQAGQDNN